MKITIESTGGDSVTLTGGSDSSFGNMLGTAVAMFMANEECLFGLEDLASAIVVFAEKVGGAEQFHLPNHAKMLIGAAGDYCEAIENDAQKEHEDCVPRDIEL